MTDRAQLRKLVYILESQLRELQDLLDVTRAALHTINKHLCPSRNQRIAEQMREEIKRCRSVQESPSPREHTGRSSKPVTSRLRTPS